MKRKLTISIIIFLQKTRKSKNINIIIFSIVVSILGKESIIKFNISYYSKGKRAFQSAFLFEF